MCGLCLLFRRLHSVFPVSSLKCSCSLALLDAVVRWEGALQDDVWHWNTTAVVWGSFAVTQSGVRIAQHVAVCTDLTRKVLRLSPGFRIVSSLMRSPWEGSSRWRCLPGFSRSHRCTSGLCEPPQHLPVFSGPVWTLLIVITGKFHQTVISGPLYKYSGIS